MNNGVRLIGLLVVHRANDCIAMELAFMRYASQVGYNMLQTICLIFDNAFDDIKNYICLFDS